MHDVVVVGAGLSGLNAARLLERRGLDVAVLEANHEVGGNVRSRRLRGEVVELGAEFVGGQHRRVRALARSARLSVEPTRLGWYPILWRDADGDRATRLPRLRASEALAAARAVARLRALARRVPPERPWTAPGAEALDRRSFGGWLTDGGLPDRPRQLLAALVQGFASKRVEELSLLQVLWWVARAGGPLRALSSGSAFRISEGAQELPRRMAGALRRPVQLGHAATKLATGADQVLVESLRGEVLAARAAVVAVSIPATALIEFDPPLALGGGADNYGQATKVVAVARKEPDVAHRLVVGGESLDLAWRRGRRLAGIARAGAGSPGQLVDELTGAFDVPAEVVHSELAEWEDKPLSGRCYLAAGPAETRAEATRRPNRHGRVWFAAAEASSWPASMEGALESGEAAAGRVAEALRG